jgi:hypothetical protein
MTGARWQRRTLAALARRRSRRAAAGAMLEHYLEASEHGRPVHEWPIPRRPPAMRGRR